MRIRSPWLPKLAGLVGPLALKSWLGTLRIHYCVADRRTDPLHPSHDGRYIYALWHEMLLLLAYARGGAGSYILVSRHRDGEYIARIAEAMGSKAVRGSTNRGGVAALKELIRRSQRFNLAIVPDGPRGPRRKVQPGIVFIASRTALPIVPIGMAFRKPWRTNSWDRFAIPKPFSSAAIVSGRAIHVPPDLDRNQLERYREQLERTMNQLTDAAEQYVLAGHRSARQPSL